LYQFDAPNPNVLETFDTPAAARRDASMMIEISTSEFTSLCPLTKQPDFATIIIRYRPKSLCVESKSLKLYFLGFRNHGAFHEACVAQIFEDLWKLLDPMTLCVTGEFTPRGGIPFWPTMTRAQPDWEGPI